MTAGVFLVASVLPVWTAWYFSSWEASGYLATFWGALAALVVALILHPVGAVISYQGWNAALLGVLLVVSLGVGRRLGRRAGRDRS